MKALLSNLTAQLDALSALHALLEAESEALSKLNGDALRRLAMEKRAAAQVSAQLQREGRAQLRRIQPEATSIRALTPQDPTTREALERHRVALEALAMEISTLNTQNSRAAQSARQIVSATLKDLGRKQGGDTYGPGIGGRR